MRIAFYVSRYADEEVQTPPSLQCLAGYLLGKGLVKEEDILFADSADHVIVFKPHILGIGSVSQCFNDAVSTASDVRVAIPDCWNILGGYHISALPENLPGVFDIGVIGEGEVTLSELIALRIRSSELDLDSLKQVKGICYHENGSVALTPKRPLIKDIDSLPPPFRRLPYGQEWPYLFTARGCPYNCIYCASQSFWEQYRPHSAEYIVNEIKRLIEGFGVSSIYFVDDLFIVPKKRLREIRRLIEQRGRLGKISFKGFVRVNLVDEEIIRILKEIGFVEVRFGMETASERLLSVIKDQPFTIKQAENIIRLCNKYEIPVCASFMFGIPGEEESDIYASIDFLRKHKGRFKISGFYLLQPVPGTVLWNDCLKKEIVSPSMDFSTLKLDFLKKDFDLGRVLYLNAEKVPLPRFKKIIEEIRAEFIDAPDQIELKGKRISKSFTIVLQKIKSLISSILHQFGFEIRRIQPAYHKWWKRNSSKLEKKQGLRLYVGCGEETKEGYVGCDMRPLPNVSIVCKAWEVSQHCSEVKEIYSRHMIEHLTLPQVEATLRDWMQALALGGIVHIVVPNMDFHIEQWRRAVWNKETWGQKWSDARHAFAGFWGWQRESDLENSEDKNAAIYWDIHKSGFNKEFLSFLLNRAGFRVIKCEIVNKVHIVAHAVKKDEVSKE